ncbi:MAG: 3-oxoacid CoA-transferase subunit A [Alphaproteobacteria bacterium]|nr:3-oxoacid CoA-transferase subunit A [Alphaproteobacteria bacterium]
MAIDKRVSSAAEALAGVRDGSTVMLSGFGGAGFANVLIRALREHGAKDLTLVANSATHPLSRTHEIVESGQVRKVICTAARGRGKELSPFEQLWKAGKIELVCLPQGTFAEAIRAGGAGIPAFYTPSGFGTELAKGMEVRRFGGRDYVLQEAITADLALLRAEHADRFGNLSFRYAQANFGPMMATAAKLAVAEVAEARHAAIPPEQVHLPGVYIDRVFATEAAGR